MPGFLQRFIHKPQGIWARRALFQIHLWAGLGVGLYLIAVGLSGSILVVRDEIEGLANSAPPVALTDKRRVDVFDAADRIRAAHPKGALYAVLLPTPDTPHYRAWVRESGRYVPVHVDPATGRILGQNRTQRCLTWIEDLHIYLLAGETGLIANGIGAICLLLLCVSGAVIWWPGIRNWKRALAVDFRRNWKRVNFDLHSATGFWPLPLICFWAVSGIYFAWPAQFVHLVKSISPVTSVERPKFVIKPGALGITPGWDVVIARARALAPHAKLAGIGFSNGPAEPIVVDMARGAEGNLLTTDYMYFHPATGEHLGTWHYGVNKTPGDWFIWLMHPLHFGTSWGLAVKLLWAALGLSLPLLSISGALMYWNRYLSSKFKGRGREVVTCAGGAEVSARSSHFPLGG